MTRILTVTVTLVLAGLSTPAVDACSCISAPLAQTFDRATLVFRGELVAAFPHPSDRCGDETLTFLPSKLWKGQSTGPIIVRNRSVGRHSDGSLPASDERVCLKMCPVFVKQRKEYIVFLFSRPFRLEYCVAPLETDHEQATELQHELDALAARQRRPKKGAG
jgi:hypothetical protein